MEELKGAIDSALEPVIKQLEQLSIQLDIINSNLNVISANLITTCNLLESSDRKLSQLTSRK